ncbi:MAG: sugar isomerase domain-containing protein, partial [bacterium]|nr:sugar isomerase domain-containing protein [bacterium]
MKAALDYFNQTLELVRRIGEREIDAIDKAAEICANSIANGGLVFIFGNGHSRMMAEEMTPRQGCYVGFFALVEHALSNHSDIVGTNGLRAPLFLEKYEGYAEEILKGFHFGPHDSFIIVSTSGIRPVIVEMALGAKRRNLPVIGICSKDHCSRSQAAHSSG